MPDPDRLVRPGLELAGLVRSGEATSRELVEAALARAEATQGTLNAFTTMDAERALAAADAVRPGDERSFAGVPMAIKDLGAAVAGLRLTNGSDLLGDYVPATDRAVTRRFKESGAIIVGATNTPEMGALPVTEPRRFGPTRNPWDTGRTPGGSSGGSAAAVAAGVVPFAHGTDGGGSLRIPAACCGLFSLKPARGRISRGPDQGDAYLSTDGVLTRSVADSAALLDVLAGYEPGDATWAPPPAEPFAASAAREPGRLRVGLTLDPAVAGAPVDPACLRATRDAAELLASLGHDVAEFRPDPWDPPELSDLFDTFWSALIAGSVAAGERVAGRPATPDDVEPLTWAFVERARAMPTTDYLEALRRLQAYGRGLVASLGAVDVLLTPALAERPLPIGTIDPSGANPMADFARAFAFTPYTAAFNVTGQPAASVPLFQGDDGLPLAVQLVGPPAGEGVVLSLAAQLEAARPWADRRPPL